jgi:hypothetical protein
MISMKTIIKYGIGFFLSIYVEAVSAQALSGSSVAIPSKTSIKGRHELRKDKRIKRHEARALKTNEKKLEAKSDKSFHKKKNRKASKDKKVEIRKNE